MEDPRGFVDKDNAQRLRVVRLETLNHESDRSVVLILHFSTTYQHWQVEVLTMLAIENPVISKMMA